MVTHRRPTTELTRRAAACLQRGLPAESPNCRKSRRSSLAIAGALLALATPTVSQAVSLDQARQKIASKLSPIQVSGDKEKAETDFRRRKQAHREQVQRCYLPQREGSDALSWITRSAMTVATTSLAGSSGKSHIRF